MLSRTAASCLLAAGLAVQPWTGVIARAAASNGTSNNGSTTTNTPVPTENSSLTPVTTPLTADKRADIFMARKMYREAIETYKEAVTGHQNRIPILLNKIGIAYHQLQQLDLAKKHYEQAYKLDKQYGEAINNIGTIYYAKRNYRKAVSYYKKALKVNPNSASIYSNLGTAQFARKKYKDALEAYQSALSLDPEVFEHRGSHGTLLQERSIQEKAKFHFYLAKTYAKAKMFDRALQYIRMALEEGFKDRNRLAEDPEFDDIRETDAFQALMAYQPKVL